MNPCPAAGCCPLLHSAALCRDRLRLADSAQTQHHICQSALAHLLSPPKTHLISRPQPFSQASMLASECRPSQTLFCGCMCMCVCVCGGGGGGGVFSDDHHHLSIWVAHCCTIFLRMTEIIRMGDYVATLLFGGMPVLELTPVQMIYKGQLKHRQRHNGSRVLSL